MAQIEPTMDSLTGRLDHLERENRRWRRATTALALAVAAVVLMGQARTPPRIIEAQEFVLRDSSGKTRAKLGVLNGAVSLFLFDNDENPRAALGVLANGTVVLDLSDRERKRSVGMSVGADGGPELTLSDRNGTSRARLTVDVGGEPSLSLYDKDSNIRALVALLPDGTPSLHLLDKAQRIRATLGHTAIETTRTGAVEERPASSLVLFDKDGKVIWRAP